MAGVSMGRPATADVRSSTPWLSLFAVGLYVVTLDQLTKDLVRTSLSPGESFHVAGTLSIQTFRNPGIAGGGFAGNAVPAAFVATLAVLAMLILLVRNGAARRSVLVGFGLLIGGGTGNLVDRVRHGYVTDFILHGNQVFNLADVAIFAGSVVIVTGLCNAYLRGRARPRTS
jgi:signal peptidase II